MKLCTKPKAEEGADIIVVDLGNSHDPEGLGGMHKATISFTQPMTMSAMDNDGLSTVNRFQA
jgi:hypothetical protein